METGRGQRRWLFDRLLRLVQNRARRSSDVHRAVLDAPRNVGWYRHIFLVARLQVERPLVAGADDAVLEDDALQSCAGCRWADCRRARSARDTGARRRHPLQRSPPPTVPSRPSRPQSSPGVQRQIVYRSRACSKAQDPSWRNTAPDEGGVVTASAPLAAAVGAEAIRSGGNARRRWPQRWPRRCCCRRSVGLGGDLIAASGGRERSRSPSSHRCLPGQAAGGAAGQLHETGPSSAGPPSAPPATWRWPSTARDSTTWRRRRSLAATASHGRRSPRHSRTRLRRSLRDQNPAGVYLPDDRPISPGARHAAGPGAPEEPSRVAVRCTVRWVRR